MKTSCRAVSLCFRLRGTTWSIWKTAFSTSLEYVPWSVEGKETTLDIREASFADLPKIQQINQLTLPENYTMEHLLNQLRCWPELTLVCKVRGTGVQDIDAYALGRVDHVEGGFGNELYEGHLYSVAVLTSCRGQGVAQSLIQELHRRMLEVYHVRSVYLHCRESNLAAIALYHKLGYVESVLLKGYYRDGENCKLMRWMPANVGF